MAKFLMPSFLFGFCYSFFVWDVINFLFGFCSLWAGFVLWSVFLLPLWIYWNSAKKKKKISKGYFLFQQRKSNHILGSSTWIILVTTSQSSSASFVTSPTVELGLQPRQSSSLPWHRSTTAEDDTDEVDKSWDEATRVIGLWDDGIELGFLCWKEKALT